MNIYFLVEGKRTEKKVYPKWLSHLLPELIEVNDPFEVKSNNYYLFNGNGFPSLLDNHLRNAVSDVNEIAKFDYLVICLDSDDETIEYRRNEVYDFIQNNNLSLDISKFIVIVQNKCIETWFLGNRKIYSKQPQSLQLRTFNRFFNVKINDPEIMTSLENFGSSAQFHEAYLSEMLFEKNIRYTKKNPNGVVEKHYLQELIKRQQDTNHLLSFKYFLDFCAEVKAFIKENI